MKILKPAILMLLVFTVLTACSVQSAESFTADFNQDNGAVNLGGYVLKFSINPITTWSVKTSAETYLGYEPNSLFGELAIQRVRDVCENMNCEIEFSYIQDLHMVMPASVAGGLNTADVVMGISDMWGDQARTGLYLGLSEVSDYIDIKDEAKWGSKAFLESMYYENDLYGVVPMAWPELVSLNYGYPLVTNTDMILGLGLPDPREYVENKTWDWETFYSMVEQCTRKDGETIIHYGLISDYRTLAEMFMFSNGSSLVEKDGDEYVLGLYGTKGVRAIDAVQKLVWGEYKGNVLVQNGYDINAQPFADLQGAMISAYTGYIYGRDAIIGRQISNFGILPWPNGPDVEPGYMFSIIENVYTAMAIPVTVNSAEATAIMLNAIFEPLDGYETEESIRAYMTHNYFFDTRDADVYFGMLDNAVYNYFHWFDASFMSGYASQRTDASTYISRYSDTFETVFEEEVVPVVKGIEAVWGSYFYDSEQAD